MRNLTHVEGMSLDVLRAGVRWDFETFPEYLDMLERGGVALNVAAFVGHSSIRTFVMGADATKRAATGDEIAGMRGLVLDAMRAGAVGLATSTAPQHNGEGGVPMPSRLADEAELRALTGALGEAGRGIFMLTKGGKTTVPFLEELAAANGRPVMIAALLHNSTRANATFEELAQIGAAQARGRRLYGQVSCCPLTLDFTLKSPYPLESLETWVPAMQAEDEDLKAVYADPGFRARVKAELERPAAVRLFNGEWHKLDLLADIPHMPSKFVEIVPLSHRQGNCIPDAAIRWHDFGNRPALGRPLGHFSRHPDTPLLSLSPRRRFPRPTPERVFVADHQSSSGFSGTGPSAPPPQPIGT